MPGLEVAAIALGAAVVKAACGVWLGDHKLVSEVGGSVIDLTAQRLTSLRERRQFRRVWEEAAELIAGRLEPLVEREFPDLPPNELHAALDAVRDTFEAAALTEEDLFTQDLDAGYLDRHLRSQDHDRVRRAGLAESAVRVYDLVLRESSAYAIEVARTLPASGMAGVAELLRRDRQILADLAEVLTRLPERRGVVDFERDYRQLVANRLDQVEFFGATLSDSSRRYALSVAYLTLTASAATSDDLLAASPVERVLARRDRVFVRGEAGIGKTTLLHWIAVQSARGTFPEHLASWNGTVPFFLPMRRYGGVLDLPAPEGFLREVGRHISDEMPPSWVQRQLRSGRAIVLVDGVDELTEQRRDEVRQWLGQLVAAFPHARYVVTSRPAAAAKDWLDGDGFLAASLEPMTRSQVPVFVGRWHEAMRGVCRTEQEREEVSEQETRLLAALDQHRHLRQLAGYPLLCALLCALHRDRRGQLPANRMELYEVALHMLLERRDRERRITTEPALGRTEQTLLLCDLAYRLIRNEWSDAARDDVVGWLAAKLRAMPQVTAGAERVYRVLLERSGLLREQVVGRVDFVHRSFQEYLAARQAIDEGDLGMLETHAHLPQWHEVVVMAAGHASATGREALLSGLLRRADAPDTPRSRRDLLRLVALASLETSPERSPELERAIRKATERLVPPRTEAAARALGRAGPFAIDLLMASKPTTEYGVVLTIKAVEEAGDPAALPLLARFGRDSRPDVVDALIKAWPRFDPDEYARTVLCDSPLRGGALGVTDPRLLPALRHLRRLTTLMAHPAELGGPIDLAFVHTLPGLRQLVALPVTDLAPLAGHPLEQLDVRGWDGPLDLAPLGSVPHLASLAVAGDLVNGDTLTGLALRSLTMDARRFYGVGAPEWPALRSLTLTNVWSLAPLRTVRLPHMRRLTVSLSDPGALDALPAAPALERLTINVFGAPPDLYALRDARIPAVALHYEGRAPLDLRPLAGHPAVEVEVAGGVEVIGEDELDPGTVKRFLADGTPVSR